MLRTLALAASVVAAALASPLEIVARQQQGGVVDHLASLTSEDHSLPFVGAPLGPFYKSTKLVTCDPVRITFGGGSGPTYFLAVVNGSAASLPPADNATLIQDPDAAQTFVRLGIMGIPGMTWWDLSDSDDDRLAVGQQVALQIVDGLGNVGYSLPRKILKGHPNEFCYYPGAIWPPSRWDGTHYSAILLFFFLVVPFSVSYLTGYKAQLREKATSWIGALAIRAHARALVERVGRRIVPARWRSRRGVGSRRTRRTRNGDETEGALQLEERLERGDHEGDDATHVLGRDDDEDDEDDEERQDSRPLMDGASGDSRRAPRARANSLPPGYEEAVRDEPPEPGATT
ncbi:hypothetical protein JCM11491_003734 [Sporobolomyces phaffii]